MDSMKRKKTQKTSKSEEGKDRLSDLPDLVLHHIMKFMDTKDAVRVSLLSKRWKNLWKSLPSLSFNRKNVRSIIQYNKSVYRILYNRDDSISLFNLKLDVYGVSAYKVLDIVIPYAESHDIQELTINMKFDSRHTITCFDPFHYTCKVQTLTSLNLFVCFADATLRFKLPKSLSLPKLKSLYMENIGFTAIKDDDDDNSFAEPFSACNSLDTLVIKQYSMQGGPKVLHISNATLSTLTLEDRMGDLKHNYSYQPEIVLSTPNLVSLIFVDNLYRSYHQVSSTCDLSLLEQVDIQSTCSWIDCSVILSWLQVFYNVKTLKLCSFILNKILEELSYDSIEVKPPSFFRLESLKMNKFWCSKVSHEDLLKTLVYLLQDSSPLNKVTITDP